MTLDGKRRRISISVPERDLVKLKTRAAQEGMPYQTLINSILHKYVEMLCVDGIHAGFLLTVCGEKVSRSDG